MNSFRGQIRLAAIIFILSLLMVFNMLVYWGFHTLLTRYVDGRLVELADILARLVAERPEAWASFYALSHINATTAVTLLAEALSLSPRARLARMLLRLADADGRVVVRQEDLAHLIGMTRSSLQRALHALAEAGAIEAGYGYLAVRDRAALESVRDES